MKWHHKILYFLVFVIFLPIIVFSFMVLGFYAPFIAIKNRKRYKNSSYYKDFQVPYKGNIIESPQYRFYNSLQDKDLIDKPNIRYVHQKNNNIDYFIFQDVLYLFPDFNGVKYNKSQGKWEIVYRKGKWEILYRKFTKERYCDIQHYIDSKKSLLDDTSIDLPIKIIVERKIIEENKLEKEALPSTLFIVQKYESAFDDVDWRIFSVIPQNINELYDMLMITPDLCGEFELIGGGIYWSYNNLFMEIDLEYIGIHKKRKHGKFSYYLTHWHPCKEEVYDDVCEITKRGNVLVVKTFMGGADVLYMGEKKKCPYKKTTKGFFSKIHYFEIE